VKTVRVGTGDADEDPLPLLVARYYEHVDFAQARCPLCRHVLVPGVGGNYREYLCPACEGG
jgi:hypothetical protein